jgi:type VI secretion system secreted protein VgrG
MVPEEEFVSSFVLSRQITSGKMTLKDFNFQRPSLDLTSHKEASSFKKLELYDYPGEYLEPDKGKQLTSIRLQEAAVFADSAEGNSVCHRFNPGFTFTLADHERDSFNQDYLLVNVIHSGTQPQTLQEQAEQADSSYSNHFVCIPSTVTFRPGRTTPKPVVEGVQTAIVTGPSGEEIYTDEHGRVKVQFHWDREGKKDEKSSCWIRVSQVWAGAGWGAMFIPRIDQEVIVDFVEGDPDRPIITGRVYHGTNTPPYTLPEDRTKSTIKSDSSLGGGGSNELRFEDKKGVEEVFLHGQKDWTIGIENDKNQNVGHDETLSVGHDRTKSVNNNQSETIGVNKDIKVGSNHSETIGSNMTLTVGSNKTETVTINTAETIGVAKELTIGAAYQVTVGAAMNETVAAAKAEEIGAAKSVIVGANSSENIGADKSVHADKNISVDSGKKMSFHSGDDFMVNGETKGVIEIKDQLTIKVGKASITLKKNGDITIQGKNINTKGSGNILMKAKKILEN